MTDASGNASFDFSFAAGEVYRFEVLKPPFAPGVIAVSVETDTGDICDQLMNELEDLQAQAADLEQELAGAAPNQKARILLAIRGVSQHITCATRARPDAPVHRNSLEPR